MTALVKTIGEALRKNCPDNDCRIFLNQYNKLTKIQEDLRGCLLSDYSVRILESECRHIACELQKMTYNNYAVNAYKREMVRG